MRFCPARMSDGQVSPLVPEHSGIGDNSAKPTTDVIQGRPHGWNGPPILVWIRSGRRCKD